MPVTSSTTAETQGGIVIMVAIVTVVLVAIVIMGGIVTAITAGIVTAITGVTAAGLAPLDAGLAPLAGVRRCTGLPFAGD